MLMKKNVVASYHDNKLVMVLGESGEVVRIGIHLHVSIKNYPRMPPH